MPQSFTRRKTLTKAGSFVLGEVEALGKPILSDFDLFGVVSEVRTAAKEIKLNLRSGRTLLKDFTAIKDNLLACRKIAPDPDYKRKSISRMLTIPDMTAEDIVCLADPLAYISHLSAMQRWGLTNRVAKALHISQPIQALAIKALSEIEVTSGVNLETWPIRLEPTKHPKQVRKMPIQVYNSERLGVSRVSPGSFTRVASIGQIFADMMQAPDLCGGMSHILSVWDEHAATYLQLIVDRVDSYCSDLGKRRAGYILEEQLKVTHPLVDKWKSKTFLDAGGKLDPSKEHGAQTSKTWNLSVNA